MAALADAGPGEHRLDDVTAAQVARGQADGGEQRRGQWRDRQGVRLLNPFTG